MDKLTLLLLFGLAIIAFVVIEISRSFLSGRRHLFSGLNIVLLGYIPFVGLSSIAFARTSGRVQIPYANYTTLHALKFMAAIIVFTVCLFLAYRYARLPRFVTEFFSRKPRSTRNQPIFLSILASLAAICCTLPIYGLTIPVFSSLLTKCLAASTIFATLFAFSSWWKDRSNFIALGMFGGVFVGCVVLAITTGSGRRPLLGVMMSVLIFVYFNRVEFLSRTRLLFTAAIGALFVLFLLNGYNSIRHRSGGLEARNKSVVERAFLKAKSIPMAAAASFSVDEKLLSDLGQNATNASLYSIRLSEKMSGTNRRTGLSYPSFGHTVYFTITNPVPRAFWDTKPNSLGYMLPQQYISGATVNWGAGIAGHIYHEGGLVMAVFYGVLIGMLVKWLDASIERDPNNLLALGLLASATPQLMLLPRGDLGIVFVNLIFCFVVLFTLRFISLKIYGLQPRSLKANAAASLRPIAVNELGPSR